MDSVGTELRHARERAHLSLQDLSARTKIRAALLAAIEREEFDRLPAGLLTRGFLRAYAREVGLDPESVVRQYIAEFEPPPPRAPAPLEPEDTEWDPLPGGRRQWTFLGPAIPLALAAAFFLRVHPPAEVAPIGTTGQQIGLVAVEQASDSVAPASGDVPVETPAPPAGDRLRLEIYPSARVWIEATADGSPVLYELVEAGERRSIDAAEEIALRVGDAAAFAYSINGRPGRTLGEPGEVRDIRITPDNYANFQAE